MKNSKLCQTRFLMICTVTFDTSEQTNGWYYTTPTCNVGSIILYNMKIKFET